MASPSPQAPRSLNSLYVVAALVSAASIAAGVAGVASASSESWAAWGAALLPAGVLGLIVTLVTWPIAIALGLAGTVRSGVNEALQPVHERLEQFSVMLNEISEQQLLSERAKGVAYREKDREALRRAIQEDVAKRDWEGALVLVDEMDLRFGYKQEAEQIRQEINQKFDEHIRRQVHSTKAVIERYTSNQQWAAAHREAVRMVEQFPTNEDALRLTTGIESQRSAYKDKLLGDYNDMIARKDVDGAIATVRQLDFYLTPTEAAGMQDSVRNVFRDKQGQLRDAFADSVHRGDWASAYRTGEVIVRDFPNTQMAAEIRDKLESLRQRAAETQGVTLTPTPAN